MNEKDRIIWKSHKGKKILYLDYSQLSGPEMVQQVEKVIAFVEKADEPVLRAVVDVTGTVETMQSRMAIMKAAKVLAGESRFYACIGLTPFKRIILNVIIKFTRVNAMVFSSDFEAKEWLVEMGI